MPVVFWLARLGIGLDRPDSYRKLQTGPIPRLGGIPVATTFVLALLAAYFFDPAGMGRWRVTLATTLMIFGLGLWDDIRPLGAKVKLVGQIVIALTSFSLGITVDVITSPSGTFNVSLGAWSLVLTVIWLVAVPNIVNLFDGHDGLAAGLGLFLYATLGIVAAYNNQAPLAMISFAITGSLLAFLTFNMPPARIFLGDGGAYLIGFGIAVLSLEGSNKGHIAATLMVVLMGLGLPIIDTTFAILRRGLRGIPLFRADAEHMHHRLLAIGFSHTKVILITYALCIVFCLTGLSIFWSQGRTLPVAVGVLFLVTVFSVRLLGYISAWDQLFNRIRSTLAFRSQMQYALLQSQLMELETDRCADPREFWDLLKKTLARIGFLDPSEHSEQDYYPVRIKLHLSVVALFHAPKHVGDIHYWKRVASCFETTLKKAMARWGKTNIQHSCPQIRISEE